MPIILCSLVYSTVSHIIFQFTWKLSISVTSYVSEPLFQSPWPLWPADLRPQRLCRVLATSAANGNGLTSSAICHLYRPIWQSPREVRARLKTWSTVCVAQRTVIFVTENRLLSIISWFHYFWIKFYSIIFLLFHCRISLHLLWKWNQLYLKI